MLRSRLMLVLLLGALATPATALDLSGTLWAVVARRHAIDPVLLYALALHEAQRPSDGGMVSPWPWTLRSPAGRQFYDGPDEARSALGTLTARGRDVEVGLLQVSLKHHGHRIGDPATLLDPGVNLGVAASVLADAISAARGDLALGVGRYRYPDDDRAARIFGGRVLAVREALRGPSRRLKVRSVIDLWRTNAVLDLVAGPESRGNYNAWYRAAQQNALQLADLTVGEVRALQKRLVRANGGSAIGRYQIIDDTLAGLVTRMGLTGKERFTPALQDRMAMQLATDAGLEDWIDGGLGDERFAANLARVWAGLPADHRGRSFYAGIQGNRATLGWRSLVASLRGIRADRTGNE
jgi:hypothetical protein